MNDRFALAFLVFLGFIIVGRFVSEAGLKKLAPEQKALLLDSQAGIRKYNLLALALVVFVAFQLPAYGSWLVGGYVLAVLGLSYRSLAKAGLPAAYMRTFVAYAGLCVIGAAVYLGLMHVW